ncbi:hypothetical protein FACS1894187_24010 [Synergistales bacterium]|nr:hypothetical protein FACS1894187_24010 [Synergistales bacterium]
MATAVAELEKKGTQKPKRRRVLPQYPQRRYGIEVDRYEDVGTIIMQEGVLPVRVMSTEEWNSVPREVQMQRKFMYPIGFPWNPVRYSMARGFKLHELTATENEARMNIDRELNHRRACERMRQVLALGFSVRYCTSDGTIYERYANGELYRVDIVYDKEKDMDIQKYTFLRMATEEDDALYDLRGTLGLTADDSAVF